MQKKIKQAEEFQKEERQKVAASEKQKAENVFKEKANVNAEHRFQVILVLLTAAATLLIEHFIEIVNFFCKFFH